MIQKTMSCIPHMSQLLLLLLVLLTSGDYVAGRPDYPYLNPYRLSAKTGSDPCAEPKNPGPCRALIPRYYFDRSLNHCKKFSYGGCGSNDNNFETMEKCLSTCRSGAGNWLPNGKYVANFLYNLLTNPRQGAGQTGYGTEKPRYARP